MVIFGNFGAFQAYQGAFKSPTIFYLAQGAGGAVNRATSAEAGDVNWVLQPVVPLADFLNEFPNATQVDGIG